MKHLPGLLLGLVIGIACGWLFRGAQPTAEAGVDPQPNIANGDVDGDGNINISDAVYLLRWLFQGGEPPPQSECVAPGSPTTRFRLLNDLVCEGGSFPAVLEVCDQSVADFYDDAVQPSDCDRVQGGRTCAVRLSASPAACGSFSLCGNVPIQADKIYDFILTLSDADELILLYYERDLGPASSCPPFPSPGDNALGFIATGCAGAGGGAGGGRLSASGAW